MGFRLMIMVILFVVCVLCSCLINCWVLGFRWWCLGGVVGLLMCGWVDLDMVWFFLLGQIFCFVFKIMCWVLFCNEVVVNFQIIFCVMWLIRDGVVIYGRLVWLIFCRCSGNLLMVCEIFCIDYGVGLCCLICLFLFISISENFLGCNCCCQMDVVVGLLLVMIMILCRFSVVGLCFSMVIWLVKVGFEVLLVKIIIGWVCYMKFCGLVLVVGRMCNLCGFL